MMTNEELRVMFFQTVARIRELEMAYKHGMGFSRADCLELRKLNQRLHAIGREMTLGSDDPEFEMFRRPHPKRPLPISMEGH